MGNFGLCIRIGVGTSINQKAVKPVIHMVDEKSNGADHIFVKSNYKAIKIVFKEILYVEGMQKYAQFHSKKGMVTTLMSLSKLVEILPSKDFMRIQKSYIANLNQIVAIEGNQLIMANNDKIPISKSIKPSLIQWLDKNQLL